MQSCRATRIVTHGARARTRIFTGACEDPHFQGRGPAFSRARVRTRIFRGEDPHFHGHRRGPAFSRARTRIFTGENPHFYGRGPAFLRATTRIFTGAGEDPAFSRARVDPHFQGWRPAFSRAQERTRIFTGEGEDPHFHRRQDPYFQVCFLLRAFYYFLTFWLVPPICENVDYGGDKESVNSKSVTYMCCTVQ